MDCALDTQITQAVSTFYKVDKDLLFRKDERRQIASVVIAKQVAIYFMWRYTTLSRQQIADMFGYKTEAIVNASRKQISVISGVNVVFKQELLNIEQMIIRN